MTTQRSTAGLAGGAEAARVKPHPVKPAQAKAVWYVLGRPSIRKLADWFKAAGMPVSRQTIGKWKRGGWPGVSVTDFEIQVGAALVHVARVAGAQSRDARPSKTEDVELNAEAKGAQLMCAPQHSLSNADLAEQALLAAIDCVSAVLDSIGEIASGARRGGAAVGAETRAALLLEEADAIAELISAASATATMTIEGFGMLAAMRAEEAAAEAALLRPIPPGHRTAPRAR
jgi:hypothetical protein